MPSEKKQGDKNNTDGINQHNVDPATVLVVEDEPTLLDLLNTLITHYGFKVLCAASIKEAQSIIQQQGNTIAFMVCDVNLSDGSGLRLANWVNNQQAINIIMISGEPDANDIFRQLDFEILGYFEKPFQIRQIVTMMQNRLNAVSAINAEPKTVERQIARQAIKDTGSV
ncbi:MAG: response regulator [Pseudomonadales bacterium]|nr:response regulator [Pseudomonadales bacterium]